MKSISPQIIRSYAQTLSTKGYASEVIHHKLTSVAEYINWAYHNDFLTYADFQQAKDEIANLQGHIGTEIPTNHHSEATIQELPSTHDKQAEKPTSVADAPIKTSKKPDSQYTPQEFRPSARIFAGAAITLLFMAILGGGIYKQFFQKTASTLAYPSTPSIASRVLSFQGRLTDSLGNPITAATDMRFRLYTASSGGSTLYDSGTCSISPDTDGIHNVLVGDDCGAEISNAVFTENTNVWMGVTVGTDAEMTPRQQIANVPYAINAETLQGLPLGTTASSVPYINQAGDLLMAAANPQIGSTFASETFLVSSANAITIQSAGSGDVTLTATESGTIKFAVGGSQAGLITNTGLFGFGTTGPDAKLDVLSTAGEQLRLTYADGSAYTSFNTSSGGDLTIAPSGGDLNLTGVLTATGDVAVNGDDITSDGTSLKVEVAGTGTTGILQVGVGGAGSTTPDYFGLGVKSDTGDPAGGFEGAMYYNTSDNKFRCYQDASWTDCISAATASPWTDSGTTSYLTDTTDEVVIGGSSPLSSAKFSIDGDADQIQTLIQGHSTQTSNIFEIETSAAADLLTLTNAGNLAIEGSLSDISGNLAINDSTDITGGLTISGNTSLGDASGDTVTANAAAWTFANDTTFALSGGVNGLNIDTNTFSVDASNDKIGIGTAAPDGKLHVTGAAVGKALAIFNETGDQDILVGSASGNTRFRVANDGTIYGGYFLDISNTAYGIDPAGTSNFGGYSLKITGGALLAADSGNVGIGDQTPDAKLNVLSTTEQLRLDYDDSNYTSFTVGSGGDLTIAPTGSDTNVTGNLAISGGTTLGDASGDTVTANAAAWTFANDTTVALTGGVDGLNFDSNTLSIDATNNRVGIGTAAPTSPLTITAGTGGTSIPILSVTQQDNSGQPPVAQFIGTGGGTVTMTWAGNISLQDTKTVHNSSYTQSYLSFSAGSTIVQSQNSTILFKDYNSGAYSEWARFSSTGSFGVNTTGPDAKIDSLSTSGEQLRLTYTDGTAYTGFTVASSGDLTLDSSGGDFNLANADVLNIGGSGTDVAYSAIGDSLAGAANVASDNDLYIEDDLEVDGTIFGSLEGTVDLNFTDGSVLFANSSGAITQDNTNFFWNDTSNRLGLGDATPDVFLDVTGTTEQLRLSYETGDTNYTSFTTSSAGDLTIAPTGADIAFTGTGDFSAGLKAGTSDHFNIDSSGNIGIGTTAASGYGSRMSKSIDSSTMSTYYLDHKAVTFTGIPSGSYYQGDAVAVTNNTTSGGPYHTLRTANFANSASTWQGYSAAGYSAYLSNNVAANSAYFTGYGSTTVNASTATAQEYTNYLSGTTNQVGGTISIARGFRSTINNASTGTISTVYNFLADTPTNGSGTITTAYGAYIADQSVGTNTTAYGLYVANQSGSSGNAIGLYIADSDDYSIQLASTDGDAASGITFGTDTNLYRNGANSLHTDDALDIDGAFTTDGDVAVNGDDITSDSNLTINAAGYVRIGDTASPVSANGDDDLFVEGDLEIDGVMYLDGTLDTSFTAGSVVFAGTSGVLAQDNSNLFFDDSSNELGIGDTTPDAFLDITGTTEQLRLSYETGDTNYASFTLGSGGDLTIAPTGTDTNITGNLATSGNTGLGDADADTTTITGKEILNFDATSLGNGDHNALYINASRSSSTASTLRGLNVSANYSATSGTQTGMNGLDFTVQASGNGGTVTTMKGISAWGVVGTGATVGTFKLVDVANPSNSGTITSLSGYSVDNLTSGTNNTLILAGTTSIPSGNWGIYNSSAYSNYLSGTTGIGTTGADAKLDVLSTTEQLRLTYADGSAYSAFTVSSGGDLTLDPTGGNIVADANFNPNTHDTYDLGTDAARWRDLYLGPDTLHVGTSTTDEGTLKYVTSTNVLTLTNNFGDTDFGSTSDGFNFTLGGGAGDDLIVDATTLVVESDNDRVGIGTAAPDAAWLDIAAATTGKAQINLTTSAATDVSAPASGDLWWNGTNLYFYNGAINKDLLAAGGTGPWTDGGSYVYTTAGEVLNLGGVTGTAYHAISDSGTTSHGLATDDDLYVEGDFEVDTAFFTDGSTTIGDASGDTVTANAAAWTFANDTTVALTGGVDGINFDSNTLSIDGTNDRVGFGTAAPSAKTHVLATTEQMRLGYDVSNYASFTTSSGGDLTVDVTGGQLLLADADTINIGGVSALAYNAIADSGGATSHGLASDDDLFVEGDTEVNGVLYADGETVLTTVSGAGLSDCDSATSILLWDSTSKQFSCGKDNNTIVLATWTEVNVVASLTDAQMDRPQPAYLSGATSEIYVPYAGNIVGISIAGSAVRTAGSATFTVFKNDGTTGFTCVIDGTNTQYNDCTQASGTDTFAAGDFLDVRITTDLGFAPSAANEYAVEIWVEMDTGADVAELYNVKDMSIRSADIVSIDPTLTDGVMKSTGSYDTSIMGVVATKPGVLLGQKDVPDIGMSRAVALTGRVPVKVTSENGPIKIGDAITSSSIPGVGMRSTRAARVVGRALSGWDNPDPSVVGTVMLFVEPAYDAGYILTQVQDMITDAKNTLVAESFTAKKIITETIKATSASFTSLIADTLTVRQATLTDAQIKNLNATALKAQTIEAEKIAAQSIKADTLEAKDAIISGTLVAGNIDAKNVREMRDRLEKLSADQSESAQSSALTADELDSQIQEIQGYITNLTNEETPDDVADLGTYQQLDQQVSLDPGTTESVLGESVQVANLEALTVTGQASMTTLAVADAFSAGEVFIKENTILSLNNELKLGALEKVTIMNGGVTITADGTITSKGEVIAEKGVRTNSIKPLESGDDVSVVLSDASENNSSFQIENTRGTRVASIDAQGSARFSDLALNTYNDATSSAVVISAHENYRQNGIYTPAIKTNAAASGNGILPAGATHILVYNTSITPQSVINLTPTSTTQNKSIYVDKVETCSADLINPEASSEICQPYFRVSLDQEIPIDATFNWLIIH